jgi:hypothetical protein
MQSKRQHQQFIRHHRRERRRLGRFVAFSEMLTDLRSVQLFDKARAHEISQRQPESPALCETFRLTDGL